MNSNRELLEQIQALVSRYLNYLDGSYNIFRLQNLETKISQDIHNPYVSASLINPNNNNYLKASTSHLRPQPTMGSTPNISIPPTSTTANAGDPRYATGIPSSSTVPNTFVYADKPSTSRITSTTTTVEPQRPYQIQTLADLRSGSLPPIDGASDGSASKQNRKEDGGAKTEPDTEDTDYSSSDQYEAHGLKSKQEPMTNVQQYNVLLSNPLHNLQSYFQIHPTTLTPNPALVTIQPVAMPQQQPVTTITSSPIMSKHHLSGQHHHTHPKFSVRDQSPENTSRHRMETHSQMSRSSPQRQASPKVGVFFEKKREGGESLRIKCRLRF